MEERVQAYLEKWVQRGDDWSALIKAIQSDPALRAACLDLWTMPALRAGISMAIDILDRAVESRSLPIKPLKESKVDTELDAEYTAMIDACLHWDDSYSVVVACRKIAHQPPFAQAQRSVYHRLPDMRPLYHLVHSCLDTQYRLDK